MPISPEQIEANAVFLTRKRQQRRVWAVRDGRVHYFARTTKPGSFWAPGHPPHLAPTVDLFCAEVDRRVSASDLAKAALGQGG